MMFIDKVISFLEFFFCFSRETDNYITCYGNIRHDFLQFQYAGFKKFHSVLSSHAFQYSVTCRLYRHMEMSHYFIRASDYLNDFISQLARFDTGNSQTVKSVDFFQISQELCKIVIFQIFTVPTCVNTREYDFLISLIHKILSLPDHFFRIPGAHQSAGPRNDTEGTEVITAFLYL